MPATVDQEALTADVREQLGNGVRWLKSHFPDLEVVPRLVAIADDVHRGLLGRRGRPGAERDQRLHGFRVRVEHAQQGLSS